MDVKTNVINLSRAPFEKLKMAKPYANSKTKMVYLHGQQSPALCVCFASVHNDRTQEPETRGGFDTKTLYAVMLMQEYEYKIANLCLINNVPFIRSQVEDNFWGFSTRPTSYGHTEQAALSYTCTFLDILHLNLI